jgi:hypothetical protein
MTFYLIIKYLGAIVIEAALLTLDNR